MSNRILGKPLKIYELLFPSLENRVPYNMELSEALTLNARPPPHSKRDTFNIIPQNTPNMPFENICIRMDPSGGFTSWNKDRTGLQDKVYFYPQSHRKQSSQPARAQAGGPCRLPKR